jgi:hypothetical protein
MKLTTCRLSILLLVSLLQACGGGGGGDGGGSGSSARLTLSATNVSASATPGDLVPERTVILTVTNNLRPVVYYTLDHSTNGLEVIQFMQTGRPARWPTARTTTRSRCGFAPMTFANLISGAARPPSARPTLSTAAAQPRPRSVPASLT